MTEAPLTKIQMTALSQMSIERASIPRITGFSHNTYAALVSAGLAHSCRAKSGSRRSGKYLRGYKLNPTTKYLEK